MKRVIVLLLVFVLLVSCKEDVVDKPENLISKKTMVDIYYDIAILNAAKSSAVNKLEENDIDPIEYLYKKYDIDSTLLAQSSVYYTSNPALQLEMFTEVEERLQKLKDTIDGKLKKKQEKNVKKQQPVKKPGAKK
ncbi:DUF4296 domain-containing protein [Galbibacter pacificus]|uniref:DUF4296 domain-containing protein n=1 Tax=Galbibacter pacificus TaxID=2996052 RepID=A0ABT6FSF0_9FLAO|nr:DUF4296 domain-containing protein [Galbibacter pacificus]MDG3582678.1 DUF4296 domain-containing protein [Galbibacter pacificus]MDG3586203.1 DUF4296 domain-containing protein [Galbibacter pacificus]